MDRKVQNIVFSNTETLHETMENGGEGGGWCAMVHVVGKDLVTEQQQILK